LTSFLPYIFKMDGTVPSASRIKIDSSGRKCLDLFRIRSFASSNYLKKVF